MKDKEIVETLHQILDKINHLDTKMRSKLSYLLSRVQDLEEKIKEKDS
jgi:uncharacterized coiled-coil protein SlyX